MKPKKIVLITKNKGKLLAAKNVFHKYNIILQSCEEDFPEIQANSSLEIAKYTALDASKKLKTPVIREDHGLYLNALNIPGPYIAYIEKKITANKLLEILECQKDRTGYFEIATVYAEPTGYIKEFVYRVPIHIKNKEIIKDPRGGWNGILCLQGEQRAFTEYPEEERLHIWNQNYVKIAKLLKKRIIS